MRRFLLTLFLLLLLPALVYAGTSQTINPAPAFVSPTATSPSRAETFNRDEDAQREGTTLESWVVSGGMAPTAGGLSHTVEATLLRARGYYVSAPATLLTYNNGFRTWLYVYSASSPVAGDFTLPAGCSIPATIGIVNISAGGAFVLVQCTAGSSLPTITLASNVYGLAPLMSVDTSGGAITAVIDESNRRFVSQVTIGSTRTVSATARWTFAHGGSVSVSGGATLTLRNADAAWPSRQLFYGSGTVLLQNTSADIGTVNPRWFGVHPDATEANNYTNVDRTMAAIAGTASVESRWRLHFPAGTYNFDSALGGSLERVIGIRNYTTVDITGDGIGATILQVNYNTTGATTFISSHNTDCPAPTSICRGPRSVRDLTLQMLNPLAATGYPAIQVVDPYVHITNVHIDGWFSLGIVVNGDTDTDNGRFIIANNSFRGVLLYCIRVINASKGVISGNRFDNSGGSDGAITLQGASHTTIVTNNHFNNTSGMQLESTVAGTPNFSTISHNTFTAGNRGIYYDAGGTLLEHLTIIGNVIDSPSEAAPFAAILLYSTQNSVISGNTIDNSGGHGIHLINGPGANPDFNSITGNVIKSSNNDNIRITTGNFNVVEGNILIDSDAGWGINLVGVGSPYFNIIGKNLLRNNFSGNNSEEAVATVAAAFVIIPSASGLNLIRAAAPVSCGLGSCIRGGQMNGQALTIINTDTSAITFLVGVDMVLNGAANVVLGFNDVLKVAWYAAGQYWVQTAPVSNN